MKIIAVERPWSQWPVTAAQALEDTGAPHPSCIDTSLIADSTTVRVGTPMFIPDFAAGWRISILPAVVISRLGKWIEPRFASRYYTDVAVAARLLPPEGSACGALACSFDGAIAPGIHLPRPADGNFTISVDGRQEISLSPDMLHIDDCVALVSRFMTLKTGDLILPCTTPLFAEPVIGSRIHVTLNGVTALDLKIR